MLSDKHITKGKVERVEKELAGSSHERKSRISNDESMDPLLEDTRIPKSSHALGSRDPGLRTKLNVACKVRERRSEVDMVLVDRDTGDLFLHCNLSSPFR